MGGHKMEGDSKGKDKWDSICKSCNIFLLSCSIFSHGSAVFLHMAVQYFVFRFVILFPSPIMANKTEIGYMIALDKCHHHHRLLLHQDILNNDDIQNSSLPLQLKNFLFSRSGEIC